MEKIAGDALDPPVVERALQGVDGVIQALGVAFGPATLIGGTTLFSRATRVLVDAMRFKGVARLVAVTGLGAGDSRGHGGLLYDSLVFPLFLKRVYDDKDVQEQIIKSSGLDWTIVRPGLLRDGPATGGRAPGGLGGLAGRLGPPHGRRRVPCRRTREPRLRRPHAAPHRVTLTTRAPARPAGRPGRGGA